MRKQSNLQVKDENFKKQAKLKNFMLTDKFNI